MKKKILFVSILAALLMVSLPFVSAIQAASVPVASTAKPTTVTSVSPSNPAVNINLQAVSRDINLIVSLSANPDTATSQQMIGIIQLSTKVLIDLGYTAEAASFNQQLQAILSSNLELQSSGFEQWGSLRCDLVLLSVVVLGALATISLGVFGILGFMLGITTQDGFIFFGVLADILAALALLFEIRWFFHCLPPQPSESTTGCSLCGDATGLITTPMPSN